MNHTEEIVVLVLSFIGLVIGISEILLTDSLNQNIIGFLIIMLSLIGAFYSGYIWKKKEI